MDALMDHYGESLPVHLLMGGLRPGATEPMSSDMEAEIRAHWEHVQKATGQTFDYTFFEREGFVYNTEPASRAVVAVRRLEPDMTFHFLKRVQKAFYALNCDITDPGMLADIAVETGLNRKTFNSEFLADETVMETNRSFEITRRLGITGFPTLMAGSKEGGIETITSVYRPWEEVKMRIEDYARRKSQS
jgi:putative protein-disulfide isomerase